MQIEKLIERAEEWKLAELRGKEVGILGHYNDGTFQLGSENFKKMIEKSGCKDFQEIELSDIRYDCRYEYKATIEGITFMCVSENRLFQNENKNAEDKNEGI